MLTDLFGPRRAQDIEDDIVLFIEQLKILGWQDMRSWNEFFSVFKPPSWDYRSLEQRVTANFLHFRTNYMSVVAAIFVLRLIFAPWLFLCIVLCVGMTIGVTGIIKQPITVGEYTFDDRAKLAACGAISFVFLGLCGALEHLLWGLLISLTLCSFHMIFRPRSVSSTANMYASDFKLASNQWESSKNGKPYDDPEAPGDQGTSSNDGIYQGGITSSTMRKRN